LGHPPCIQQYSPKSIYIYIYIYIYISAAFRMSWSLFSTTDVPYTTFEVRTCNSASFNQRNKRRMSKVRRKTSITHSSLPNPPVASLHSIKKRKKKDKRQKLSAETYLLLFLYITNTCQNIFISDIFFIFIW
jgi:hypothetical protein